MKKSIVTILAVATFASSFAGVAMAQSRGDNGGGRGGNGGHGSDGQEYLRVINQRPRYVMVKGDVFCMVEKVRRHDAYGNLYFEHVRKCENRVVDVY
jgi:hypothetical protein